MPRETHPGAAPAPLRPRPPQERGPSTAVSPTQVRCGATGRLTACCVPCGVDLVQAPDADVEAALTALDEAHPAIRDAPHSSGTPAGWHRAFAQAAVRKR